MAEIGARISFFGKFGKNGKEQSGISMKKCPRVHVRRRGGGMKLRTHVAKLKERKREHGLSLIALCGRNSFESREANRVT
jgi:hypothetical protein